MPSPAAIRFGALLSENIGQLVHFVELLKREQELLVEGKAEELLSLAEDKTAAVRLLQSGENTRTLVLARDGVNTSTQGIQAFVRSESQALQNAWARYLDLARQADELNRLNGKLIRQQMQNNQQALAILLSASEIPLYGADGQTTTKPPGRLFDSV